MLHNTWSEFWFGPFVTDTHTHRERAHLTRCGCCGSTCESETSGLISIVFFFCFRFLHLNSHLEEEEGVVTSVVQTLQPAASSISRSQVKPSSGRHHGPAERRSGLKDPRLFHWETEDSSKTQSGLDLRRKRTPGITADDTDSSCPRITVTCQRISSGMTVARHICRRSEAQRCESEGRTSWLALD